MRRVLALLIVVLALAGAVALALADTERLRLEAARGLAAALGRPVTIAGPVELALGPRPTLTLHGVALAEAPGPAAHLSAEVVRLSLAWPALLTGRLAWDAVTLVRPQLELEGRGEGSVGMEAPSGGVWQPALGALPFLDRLAGQGPIDLRIERGLVMPAEDGGATAPALEVDGTVVLPAAGSGRLVEARLSLVAGRWAINLTLAADPDRGEAIPFRLGLTDQPSGAALTVTGRATATGLAGRAELAAPDLARLLGAPSAAPLPLSASGELILDAEGLRIEPLEALLAGARGEGRFMLGARPPARLALAFGPLPLAPLLDALPPEAHPLPLLVDGLPPLAALPAALAALQTRLAALLAEAPALEIDLGAAAVVIGRRQLPRPLLMLASGDGGGVATLEAGLPGGGRLDASLGFDPARTTPLTGRLAVATPALRLALPLFGLDLPPEHLPGQLSAGRLEATLAAGPEGLRLDMTELELDAARLGGRLRLDADGVAVEAELAGVDLDALGLTAPLAQAGRLLLRRPALLDLSVVLAATDTRLAGVPLAAARLEGTLAGRRLALATLEARSAGGLAGRLAGTLEPPGAADPGRLDWTLDGPAEAPLLNRVTAGRAPALAPEGRLAAAGILMGRGEGVTLEGRARLGLLTLDLVPDGEGLGRLALEHPDGLALASALAGLAPPEPRPRIATRLAGTVRVEGEGWAVDGLEGSLDDVTLSGRLRAGAEGVEGALAFDRLTPALWALPPGLRLGAASPLPVGLDLTAGRVELPAFALESAQARLELGPAGARLDCLEGAAAGGRLRLCAEAPAQGRDRLLLDLEVEEARLDGLLAAAPPGLGLPLDLTARLASPVGIPALAPAGLSGEVTARIAGSELTVPVVAGLARVEGVLLPGLGVLDLRADLASGRWQAVLLTGPEAAPRRAEGLLPPLAPPPAAAPDGP